MKLRGVYVALATPFTPEGELDVPGLDRLIDSVLRAGAHGLVPCGTTGESPVLSREERRQVISLAVERGRSVGVEVIAGAGSYATAAAQELIAEAEELGCDGTLIVTPYYNKPTAAGVVAHYEKLADTARKPLVLYHVPGRTQVSLPLESVRRLFAHPNIAGIKEASGNYSYWLGLAQIARDTGKAVMAGDDDAVAIQQAFGAQGVISASANVVPEAYVHLHQLMESGDWKAAFDLQLRLVPLVRALFQETNPAPTKYLLSKKLGLANHLRLPLVPVSDACADALEKAWDGFHSEAR
ncbi:4-hydroxy-tetrahydrodipicolinate synthase [bacterium]|nr:4-hydroxy-tetrahydrodipicolinate synthase [bacterium]